jgi:superfamily II DNA/RNA helicase
MTDSFEDRAALPMPAHDNAFVEGDSSPSAPVAAAPADVSAFAALGLAEPLLRAVADMGYTQPTTVQLQTVPMAMGDIAGFNDLMVSSQTGSGKTAAFLLPVLHTLIRQQEADEAAERAERERLAAEAVARGETSPKKPRRKDPTNPRHFKAAEPGALILCPTRELAQQVAHDAIELVKHCRGLRVVALNSTLKVSRHGLCRKKTHGSPRDETR